MLKLDVDVELYQIVPSSVRDLVSKQQNQKPQKKLEVSDWGIGGLGDWVMGC